MSRYIVQRAWTRDARIPRIAGDWEFEHGWQCVPLPPSLDGDWEIFDTSKDHKTGWMRRLPTNPSRQGNGSEQLSLF